jgi:hypothetical protein
MKVITITNVIKVWDASALVLLQLFHVLQLPHFIYISFTRSSNSADCSFAFLIAIVSTIAATSGYRFAQASISSSDLGSRISCLVAWLSCFQVH